MADSAVTKPVPPFLEELAEEATTVRVYPPDEAGKVLVELLDDSRILIASAFADSEQAAIDAIADDVRANRKAGHRKRT